MATAAEITLATHKVPSAQASMSFSVDAASAEMLREITSSCGALIAGRRLFDQTDGWG